MEQSPPQPQGAEKRPRLAMAEQGATSADFLLAPVDVILEIVRRLPAKSVIRLRAVCKAWREVTSDADFVAALHGLQPSQPVLGFSRVVLPHRYIELRDYYVVALDFRSDELRSIFHVTDHNSFGYNEIVHEDALDHGSDDDVLEDSDDEFFENDDDDNDALEGNGVDALEDNDEFMPQPLMVHASLDGLLLVSFISNWYLCNPATRQWAVLPGLDYRDVIGLYRHASSGEYRVLYHTGKDDEEALTCYYVLTVGSQVARSIGCPISPAAVEDLGLIHGLEPSSASPPVQINGKLHWAPQFRQSAHHIVVFDTEAEVFSWMVSPVRKRNVTSEQLLLGEIEIGLLELDGRLGLSVFSSYAAMLELWRLEDYHNLAWNMLHLIELPVQQMYEEISFPSFTSSDGDVMIVHRDGVAHFDRHGKTLQCFWFHERTMVVLVSFKHRLKDSLLPHALFLEPKGDDAVEPPFFRDL